ncbi:alpha/beta fold hydrolase [Halocatena halophila]|uniref:alpha/beta fold hydrolase n=1 Tax=Halocatena halophila TaxID=2814576 RepID=UPI002ED054BC
MNPPAGWTGDTVSVNGVSLQYYRVGSGPPLVVAHGLYEDSLCWERLITDLSDDFSVVAYDARAHGGSEAPAGGYTIDDRVNDLVGLLTELDLSDPILIGHSMGASTAAWTAVEHPELPRALVLEETAGLVPQNDLSADERVELVDERLTTIQEQSIEELASEYESYSESVARQFARANKASQSAITKVARAGFPSPADRFEEISRPTLLLQADTEPAHRARELDMAERLPNGRLVHIPDAGHAVFADCYDAAYAELRAFLCRL